MNVEIRTEATQFPEKEYINRIFFEVYKQENADRKTWKTNKIL
jgi:hypothetical protein